MIGDRTVLAVIAARGGSKGLPRKNVLDLGGKPLIAWSIDAAAGSKYIDRAVVSTDDTEIADAAKAHGGDVPFLRPSHLATDEVSIYGAIFHAIDTVDQPFDLVVLLQATAPLRTAGDIDACLELLVETGAPSAVTVTTPAHSPYWSFALSDDGHLKPIFDFDPETKRRQDLPPAVISNGAVYAADISWLRRTENFYTDETVASVMPRERSVDIDDALDLSLARAIVGERPASA